MSQKPVLQQFIHLSLFLIAGWAVLNSCADQNATTFSKETVKKDGPQQTTDATVKQSGSTGNENPVFDANSASGAVPALEADAGSKTQVTESAVAAATVPPNVTTSEKIVVVPPVSPTPTPKPTSSVLSESLPPVPKGSVESLEKVGINFEDSESGDNDYNDSVLCFKGKLVVDPVAQTVTSRTEQTVTALYTRHADCNNKIAVDVFHADGTREQRQTLSIANNGTTSVNLKFKANSRLEVYLLAGTPCSKAYLGEVSMHSKNDALVKVDLCNTTGN